MNILLTGGTGYIGSHTAVVLSSLGHRVVLYDNLSNSNEAVLDMLKHITGKKMPFVHADVRDADALRHVFTTHRFDAVVHFAGLKAVGESVQAPIDYYANNVAGTISLLHAMQEHSVHRLVFSSSATVYGEPQYLPLDENHPTSAANPYGRTKLHIEEMLRDLAASDAQWHIACLRYFNPVGAHRSGLIGENPNGAPNNLMPYIAKVASGQRKELRVFGGNYPTADGTGVRDYIHVMDLAQGHAAAMNLLHATPGWHAVNLGTGQGYSVLEMVSAFEHVSGQKIPYQIVARRAGDVAACYANPRKAFALMGWQAQCTLQDMCASAWNFQQSVTTNPASD